MRQNCWAYACAVLVFLWLFTWSVSARTLLVSQDLQDGTVSFDAAMLDARADEIVILEDVVVGAGLELYDGLDRPSISLNRNLTIRGHDPTGPPVLDLAYMESVLGLCSNCTLRLESLALKRERKGSGGALDFVRGQPGSLLVITNISRVRAFCMPPQATQQLVISTPRSTRFPGTQVASIVDSASFRGTAYGPSVFFHDFTADLASSYEEGRGWDQGYTLVQLGVLRMCAALVDPSCLEHQSADACVQDLLHSQHSSQSGANQRHWLLTLATIMGPLVAVATAAAAFLLWRRRRAQQQGPAGTRPGPGLGAIIHAATNSGDKPSCSTRCVPGSVLLVDMLQRPDWQLVAGSHLSAVGLSRPSFERHEDNIALTALLGSSALGRVYRGRWCGRDVVVRVVQHDSSTAAQVASWLKLFTSFDHPHVIKVLRFRCCIEGGRCLQNPVVPGRQGPGLVEQLVHKQQHASSLSAPASPAACFVHRGKATPASQPLYHSQPALQPCYEAAGQEDSSNSGPLPPIPRFILLDHPCSLDGGHMVHSSDGGHPTTAVCLSNSTPGATSDAATAAEAGLPGSEAAASCTAAGAAEGEPPASGNKAAATPPAAAAGTAVTSVASASRPLGEQQQQQEGSKVADSRDAGGASPAETWLVQEYCDQHSLVQALSRWRHLPRYSHQRLVAVLGLMRDAAAGMAYLHRRNVVQGNLNMANVLVCTSSQAPSGLVAKVGDFGLTACLKPAGRVLHPKAWSSSAAHMAPELLRLGRSSPATDVFAFGITLWEALTGGEAGAVQLHDAQPLEAVAGRGPRPPCEAGVPAPLEALMAGCWQADPALRPSMDTVAEQLEQLLAETAAQPGVAGNAAGGLYGATHSGSCLVRDLF